VELLDFSGPGEVFAAATFHSGGTGLVFNVYTVAPEPGALISQGFVTIEPEYTIDNCPKPDVVVFPGGGVGSLLGDEKFMGWAKQATTEAKVAMSVCNGAFVLANNGNLDGLEATTHFGSIRRLREQFEKTEVVENVRFVDNGQIVTTAGVSAGIDGALHVIAKLANFEAAKDTARYMEYEWTAAEKTRGMLSASQRAEADRIEKRNEAFEKAHQSISDQKWGEAVAAFEKLTEAYPEDKESWYYLGLANHHLENYQEALRAAERAAALPGYVPHRPVYNIACAYARLGRTEYALNALEQAIALGMTDRGYIENDGDLESLRDEPRYREMVGKLEAAH